MGSRLTLALVAALLVSHPARSCAIVLPLTRSDMARAIGLARWPHTDAERARFHARYEVRPAPETPFALTVERVEIVTASDRRCRRSQSALARGRLRGLTSIWAR